MRFLLFSKLNYKHCRLLAIAWMAFIFMMSSQPTIPIPQVGIGQDKFMHFIAYGILGFLLAKSFKDSNNGLALKQIIIAGLFALLYGASDEIHQSFVAGRDASWADLLADGIGGFVGAFLLLRRSKKEN